MTDREAGTAILLLPGRPPVKCRCSRGPHPWILQEQLLPALLREDGERDLDHLRAAERQAELLDDTEGAHGIQVGQLELPQVAPGAGPAGTGGHALHLSPASAAPFRTDAIGRGVPRDARSAAPGPGV